MQPNAYLDKRKKPSSTTTSRSQGGFASTYVPSSAKVVKIQTEDPRRRIQFPEEDDEDDDGDYDESGNPLENHPKVRAKAKASRAAAAAAAAATAVASTSTTPPIDPRPASGINGGVLRLTPAASAAAAKKKYDRMMDRAVAKVGSLDDSDDIIDLDHPFDARKEHEGVDDEATDGSKKRVGNDDNDEPEIDEDEDYEYNQTQSY